MSLLGKIRKKKKTNNPELALDIILNFYWFTHIQRCWNPLAMQPRAQVLEGPGATVAHHLDPVLPVRILLGHRSPHLQAAIPLRGWAAPTITWPSLTPSVPWWSLSSHTVSHWLLFFLPFPHCSGREWAFHHSRAEDNHRSQLER